VSDLFSFQILGQCIGVRCAERELLSLVRANWDYMASDARPERVYSVVRESSGVISLRPPDETPIESADASEFLHLLERNLVFELQKRRADLYFLHAAAVESEGKASLFIAESGGGKSTITWGLLHHGFAYLSDELAPIDLQRILVHAYPHALNLKQSPPSPYGLPAETVHTARTSHVPVPLLPRVAAPGSYPLASLWFVTYRPALTTPAVRSITPGEASVRLYANTLNQLAHPNAGLDAAVRIAAAVPSFLLESTGLDATCALVRSTLDAADIP
jgi:hypothetical protein